MGDSREPCGIPVGVLIVAVIVPLKHICMVRPVRKLRVMLIIAAGIRLFFMLWSSQLWCMLLKVPATSMKITLYASPSFHARYILSVSTVIASVVVIEVFPRNDLPVVVHVFRQDS